MMKWDSAWTLIINIFFHIDAFTAMRGIGILAVGLSLPVLLFSQQPQSLAERIEALKK